MAVTVEGDFEDEVQDEQDVEVEAVAEDDQSEVADDQPEAEQQTEDQSDDVVVTIGEEAPPAEEHAPAPAWVKELRKANREKDRRIRELEAKLQTPSAETKPALGKKPTIEDHDYDTEAYEAALSNWFEQKRKVEEAEAIQRKAEEEQQQKNLSKLQAYAEKRKELKLSDYEDAEAVVQEVLSVPQQSILLHGCENPAVVVYALGKNLAKLQELAKKTDLTEFAFAAAKLEAQVKLTSKKSMAPPPEKRLSGTGRSSASLEDRLEAARKKAEQTGDMSEVVRIKREMRNKS